MDLTATVLALLGGQLSAVNLVDELLQRAESWRSLNAIIFQDHDALMEAATAADLRPADARGPLHGAPLLIKDNIDVVGCPTTCCTRALARNMPDKSAAVIERLLNKGGISFGKANMHELALGVTSAESLYGPVRNPYDQGRMAGGSSGGTAAAVATGIVPAGLGSDTGGSTRIPAALCGICGLRPSPGRYPMDGVVPLAPTRDTVGPMARSVRDLGLLDAVMAGEPITQLDPRDRLRIGIPREFFHDRLAPGVATVIDSVMARLANAGHELVEADIPDVESLNRAIAAPVMLDEVHRYLPAYLEKRLPALSFADFIADVEGADVRQVLEIDAEQLQWFADAYPQAINEYQPRLQAAYREYFASHRVDAVLIPATALTACSLDTGQHLNLNGKSVSVTAVYVRNAVPATTAGNPSLAIPAGLADDGLPVGLMLESLPGSDRDLLAAGLAIESLLDPLPPPRL